MDHERDVDVRCDDLLARHARRRLVRRPTGDRRPSREHDGDRSGRVERDPVTDDGELLAWGLPAEAIRDPASALAVRRQDVVLAPMLHCDAPGHESLSGVRLERGIPVVVPAERLKLGHVAHCRRPVSRR